MYAEIAKLYSKNKSLVHAIVTKQKEIHASLAVTPQTAKVVVIVCDKCLVKLEKALGFYSFRESKRDHIHINFITVYS